MAKANASNANNPGSDFISTPARDVPLGTQSHAQDEFTSAFFVGSPESVSTLPGQSLTDYNASQNIRSHPSAEPTQASSPAVRPHMARRVTSPATLTARRTVYQGLGQSVDALRLRQSSHQADQNQEWSLFGDILAAHSVDEHERRLRSFSAMASTIRSDTGSTFRNISHHDTSFISGLPPTSSQSVPSRSPISNLELIPEPEDESPDQTVRGSDGAPDMSEQEHVDSEHEATLQKTASRRSYLPTFSLSPLQRNIIKCCVAYFIGSLFTYSPYLSGFIADITGGDPGDRTPSPSGHMVATIAVYFNPAKTVGAMFDADKFCLMGLLYASFISLVSVTMYWFFETRAGWEWLADVLVILWIGLGMSGMAYMKMWMGKPTFNTACSMTSIILFTVVVKEGGWETLLEVSIIVIFGALVSNLVCFVLWPQRATRNLHATMSQTLDSFSTLLTMITDTFLLEEPLHLMSQEKLDKATKNHQTSFTKLKKDLSEAQSERLVGGPGKPIIGPKLWSPNEQDLGMAYENAVTSLNRLGQHLNGLRSGISVQYELVKASRDGKLHLRSQPKFHQSTNTSIHDPDATPASKDVEENILLQAAADAFGDVIEDLGPPLKALSATCSGTLKRLREVFNNPDKITSMNAEEFVDLAENVERALYTFESTSNHAVLRLYRRGLGSQSFSRVSESLQAPADDNSVLMGAESENIFLVYFFFFTIQEFSKELVALVDAMSQICNIREANARSWRALMTVPFKLFHTCTGTRTSDLRRRNKAGLRQRLSMVFESPLKYGRDARVPKFPKIEPHAPHTKQTPSRAELSFTGRVGRTLWSIGAALQEKNSKFAIKAGMATAMLAAPAFFDATRPIFNEYKGEWALISFFVVISPTVGATNFLGIHRVLGTILGAATAVGIWTAFPENPYALSIFGVFFSVPCFYYIVSRPDLAASGRFVLLAYNLTCLYCYNLRQVDVSVVDIAFHRATAVIVGVVWAAIVSRFWWPIEARRELGKALGEFCLNIGWLYTRLVAFNSWENNSEPFIGNVEETPTENTALLQSREHLNESIIEFMAMELHLQIKLIELQGLLAQTQNEPRLKGPFPIKLYRSMLTSLQTILDKLHSMRCVTSREEWHTTVRRDFILPTNAPRREMVGNVILYFSVLAAAFRLKSPLPPYLPPAEKARERLVTAIRQLDVVKNREIKGSRQLLFFAYALTMRGVIHELDYLGRTLQDTFGVIGESTDAFEALFRETAHDTV